MKTIMSPAVRNLRLFQIACLLFVVLMVVMVDHLPSSSQASVMAQYFVVVFAAWAAFTGFSMQKRFARMRTPQQKPQGKRQSTPFTRWRSGHWMRLASAMSVGLWAFLLHFIGGNHWVVDALFAASIVLLLLWQPGKSPNPKHSQL